MNVSQTHHDALSDAIAIVGLSGRFPGAGSVQAFWSAILEGRELFSPHPPETLADAFSDAERAQPNYVPVRPSLDDAGLFDAEFFGMMPREASMTDPQFRVFLETCWEALEDAGHDPARAPGPVGVFGGAAMSTYFLNSVLKDRATLETIVSNYQLGEFPALTGALGDTLATRVAFKLGLTGPAMTVGCACSTSLVAIAQAVQSLLAHQCDMALAGGVCITFPQQRGYFYLEGGMAARDGHCRPFDAEASGTVFGHGAGVVALRRYGDAVADGNSIYALIRGVGLNNDGNDKIAFTAPSVMGQALAIADAQGVAGVAPDSIGYIECHGTATPLGDPIEFEALSRVFAGVPAGRVRLGSVKANVGHLDAAAGVAGVIKTALMLRNRVIPPMTNYTAPNPRIRLSGSPFDIPTQARPWQEAGPLRAGVSSLGVGGTNAHLILEEAPAIATVSTEGMQILPLSARSEAALAAMAQRLANALESEGAPDLASVASTLQDGRSVFDYRAAIAAETLADASAQLRAPMRAVKATRPAPDVRFLFPGQGAQYPLMAAGLYEAEPAFRAVFAQGSAFLAPLIGLELEALVFGSNDPAKAAATLRNTAVTQPALYLIEYALARLWQSRGVTPQAMIGHSVGEFAAATLAKVMSFETGMTLIAARGRLMQEQAPGSMLSVRGTLEDVAGLVPEGVDLAARNAPRLQVYAGPDDRIAAFEEALNDAGVASSRLQTSHAFHSAMMDTVVDAIAEVAAGCDLRAPEIPIVSCVTGTWLTDAEAVDPHYWGRHCRATVNFHQAVQVLCDTDTPPVLLEVGPGRTLSAFAAQGLKRGAAAAVVQSLPDHRREVGDRQAMAAAHGALWCAGVAVDWSALRTGAIRRVSLPTYPFERKLHWIEPPIPVARQSSAAPVPHPVPDAKFFSEASPVMLQTVSRIDTLSSRLFDLLSELSGETITAEDAAATFLELGFDSLLLGQVAQRLARDFGFEVTFNQLMTEYPSVAVLSAHMDAVLPPEPEQVASTPVQPQGAIVVQAVAGASQPIAPADGLASVMQAQTQAMLALFDSQLRAVGGAAAAPLPAAAASPSSAAPEAPAPSGRAPVKAAAADSKPDRFDLNRRRAAQAELTPAQTELVTRLTEEMATRFPTSMCRTQENRRALADPRTAAGFRREWKDLVFPVVVERSSGAMLRDLDGNELIDLVNGFGQTAFGHAPDFVTKAVAAQLEKGFAIGPQTPLAHEVARKFLSLTGHERVTFCNTGSEAVMAAMRVARSITGRDTVVTFKGDYHGQFDEVLVKGRASGDPTAQPAVTGVPARSVSNMVVLAYGAPQSLDWIRENRAEIAAILVEPVQSRHPELRPRAFCQELRAIATDCGAALIFDEVVTGFRVAPGGMQQIWGIDVDLATYGKVVGGGLPVGVLAGKARFMDALDGGFWSFGDASVPEVSPTFFAGTFVRHPLVLAAMSAVLDHIVNETGHDLYDRVAPRTTQLQDALNDILEDRGLPRAFTGFSSWLICNLTDADARAALLFPLMRLRGVHVIDGFPWFFTTAHGEAEFERVASAFEDSLDALCAVGILADASQRGAVEHLPVQVPLTEPQKEIWMAAQLGDAASGAFIESGSLTLEGPLDTDALAGALNAVIARHDALRMRFAPNGEAAEVMARLRLPLIPEDMDQQALDAAIADEASMPFDLVEGPLIRARLARLSPEKHVLILSYHHIVCDGWSAYLVFEDLAAFYNARAGGQGADPGPGQSFAAFARAQAGKQPSTDTIDFWKGKFPVAPELPELPTANRRAGRRSFSGATHVHTIDAGLANSLKRVAGRAGVSMFGALAGTLALLLGRLSDASEVVLAVPTAGQTALEDQRLVGHCVNLLPVPVPVGPDTTLRVHLGQAARRVLECFAHGDITYGTILRATGIKGDAHRQPLSEVQFNLDQQPDDFGFFGLASSLKAHQRAFTNFDLIFNVTQSPSGLRLDLTYATDLVAADEAAQWCRHFHTLLEAVVADLDAQAGRVSLLAGSEASALAELGRGPVMALPQMRIEELVARQAVATPGAIAVEDGQRAVTYGELMRESDSIAAMIAQQVPEPGGRIGVLLERSVDLVAALLGVLKAGHAYVPLDPGHPGARLHMVLETARMQGLISRGAAPEAASGLPIALIDLDSPRPDSAPHPRADHPRDGSAYVIFTSGSTGVPKGVEIAHTSVVNFLLSMQEKPGFSAADTLLSVTTVAFDIAALELFLPLISGGRVVLASSDDVLEAFPVVERLGRGDITVMQATPTLWQMLLEAGLSPDPALKALVGGEPLPRTLAGQLTGAGCAVWNMYGPTETTIWSTCERVGDGRISIGHPIANTTLHILDAFDNPVPVGVTGELNIGGAGLAKGYFDRPELTEQAFRMVDVRGAGKERLYRTGDLAVRHADGTLELLGRRDAQVKLRGFRIEMGDVEAAIQSVPGVRAAAAALRNGATGPHLVAYYVAGDDAPPTTELARTVAGLLPGYMVPTRWLALPELPRTANGKLDRKALPDAEIRPEPVARTIVPPTTPLEASLLEIWCEVLDIPEMSVDDDLFDLGADSLSIFRIAARMSERDIRLEARHLLQHPTIRAAAACAADRPAPTHKRPSLKDFHRGARRGARVNA